MELSALVKPVRSGVLAATTLLYSYLKRVMRHADASGKVVTVSGATSTGAMISCSEILRMEC